MPGFFNRHDAPSDEALSELKMESRIKQRRKQIIFGLVTSEYYNLRAHHPEQDKWPEDIIPPPDIELSRPKREFDAKLKEWRRYLHQWNDRIPPAGYEINPAWISEALPEIEQAKLAVRLYTKNALVEDYGAFFFDVQRLAQDNG